MSFDRRFRYLIFRAIERLALIPLILLCLVFSNSLLFSYCSSVCVCVFCSFMIVFIFDFSLKGSSNIFCRAGFVVIDSFILFYYEKHFFLL